MGVDPAATCFERLEQLIALALGFHGWTRAELSRRLGRNASNIVPDSGLPKLDYIVSLADVLDWPIDHVVDWIVGDSRKSAPVEDDGRSFEELNRAYLTEYENGSYDKLLDIANRVVAAAKDGKERAVGFIRMAGAHACQGRYRQMLEVCRSGLQEQHDSSTYRSALLSNLSLAYHALELAPEALSISELILREFNNTTPESAADQVTYAFAHYVAGDCERMFSVVDMGVDSTHAQRAKQHLTAAISLFESIADSHQRSSCLGVANTCRGSLYEVEVRLLERDPDATLDLIECELSQLRENGYPAGARLESFGWWCIYGCNIASKHITDPKRQQQLLRSFTLAADEIARRLDNWVLRQKVYAHEFERRRLLADLSGVEPEWTINSDELADILGAIGRFPSFCSIGRKILTQAVYVRDRGSKK